jgi:hypothetical protein
MASTPEMRAAVVGAWVRPLLAAAFLAGISVWLTCAPPAVRTQPAMLTASLLPPAPSSRPGVIMTPAIRDALEWPRGMVIKPPSTNDRIAVSGAGPLDILLSALLAPWLATAS